MTNQTNTSIPQDNENVAKAQIRHTKRISPFWLLPFIAFCIGAMLFFQIIKEQGTTIRITFNNGEGLIANKTQVRYQGLQIGVVKKVNFTEDMKNIVAEANIYPEAEKVLRENTRFWLVKPSASLAGISGLDALVSGNYISLQPGDGEEQFEFIAETDSPITQLDEGDLLVHLEAEDLGSISEGASVYFKKMPVGKVYSYRINKDNNKIEIQLIINKKYAHFVKQDSRFWNISGIQANMDLSGIQFNMESLNAVVQGAVAFDSPEDSPIAEQNQRYPLYTDYQTANQATNGDNLPTITLRTKVLPNIATDALVLYRQFEVGKVTGIRPMENDFEIDVLIYPKHRHLLTEKSRFWIENATQVDVGPRGINIQAAPLGRVLKGAVSFDNIAQNHNINEINDTLYESELRARSEGKTIQLTAESAVNLSKGMPLRYMGLTVGEIENIRPDRKNEKVIADALIHPNYRALLAKEGSQFKVISPQISAGGIENLGSLFQPYIDVQFGKGKTQTQFSLLDEATPNHKFKGFPLILETADASNLTTNSPVMYRGIDVGKVHKLELNSLGDRVLVHILIDTKHQHLVRNNSEFWISSGYSAEMGWNGIAINTGSVQQLLKGGISFATPSGTVVQPAAKANQRFLLQNKRPEQSKQWNQGAITN